MVYTVNDFFCGSGGFGLGFQQAGYKILGAWDFNKAAVASYRENLGDHVEQRDVRDMTGEEVPSADVWAFGFPCTDISVAGKKKGIDGDKSRVFFEVMRLIGEVDEKPKILLAENVKRVIHDMDVVVEEFDKAGYTTAYQLYNSSYWVPQKRERYFIVGIRKDLVGEFNFPKQSTEVKPLSEALEDTVDPKYYIDEESTSKIVEQALQRLDKLDGVHACLTPKRVNKRQQGRRAKPNDEVMFTLTTQDRHGVIDARDGKPRVRLLTPRECANLQGYPRDYRFIVPDSNLYVQFGNSVSVPISHAIATAIKEFLKAQPKK